jgi:hypothetical protein
MVSHSSSVTSSLAMFSCYPVNGFVRLTKPSLVGGGTQKHGRHAPRSFHRGP